MWLIGPQRWFASNRRVGLKLATQASRITLGGRWISTVYGFLTNARVVLTRSDELILLCHVSVADAEMPLGAGA